MPLFHNVDTIKEFKRCEPPRMGGQQAIIYNSDNYHELLKHRDVRLDRYDDQDTIDNRTVRFSLSIYYDIKFGKEGPPNKKTPAHEKLTGKLSLIAGNFGFDIENNVCIITNKSNDYTPDFNSLQYVLIVMLKENKFTFAKDLVFRKYSKEIESEQIRITSEELIAELMALDFYKNYDAIVIPAKEALEDAVPASPANLLGKRKFEFEIASSETPVTPREEKPTPTAPRSTPHGTVVRSSLFSMFAPASPTIPASSASRPSRGFISSNRFAGMAPANPLTSPSSTLGWSFLHEAVVPPLSLQSPPRSSALFSSPLPQSPQIKEFLAGLEIPKPDFTQIAPK